MLIGSVGNGQLRLLSFLLLFLSVQIASSQSSTLADQSDKISAQSSDQNQSEIADSAYSEKSAGFRIEHYRSPVPKLLTGATTVTTAELKSFPNKEHLLAPILSMYFQRLKNLKGGQQAKFGFLSPISQYRALSGYLKWVSARSIRR